MYAHAASSLAQPEEAALSILRRCGVQNQIFRWLVANAIRSVKLTCSGLLRVRFGVLILAVVLFELSIDRLATYA